MVDSVFGEIEFVIDAWNGRSPFKFPQARMGQFYVHIRAGASGPSAVQRATFDQLRARYTTLWPGIAQSLVACHPILSTAEEVERSLRPTVGCYIEAGASAGHNDFELVYEFNLPGEGVRGFFVRIVGWEVVEAVMAD